MALMAAFISMDDGGRRVENIGLRGADVSPEEAAFQSMGDHNFKEALPRHTAEEHAKSDDKRKERDKHGHVPFRIEPNVPDVGGLGWRTKAGQMIKNQNFYSQKTKVNKWDDPTFAGVNSWKEWHGPKQRADADTMERLDKFDHESRVWEAKRTFVNTTRAETLDRFYNQKLNRTQREVAGSWAPQRHPRREVHSSFETFDSSLDEKPVKELKKVFTPAVLKRDREAMRMIASRIQNEHTWKKVFSDIEQERRADIRADFQLRQAHNDRLMLLSGQPVLERDLEEDQLEPLNSLSFRGDALSMPSFKGSPPDVSKMSDFRGLIHVENEHALEALFPGSGHELSVKFRQNIAKSAEPGWPRPPRAETPKHGGTDQQRELEVREASVAQSSIPASQHRLDNLCSRRHDSMLARHSKAQFLATVQPPPLDQSKTLLAEDYSQSSTLRHGKIVASRITGDFSRTSHVNNTKSMGDLPPPRRSVVYPVLAPTAGHSKAPVDVSHMSSMAGGASRQMSQSVSAPSIGRRHSCIASKEASRQSRASRVEGARKTSELCRELDSWEAGTQKVPGINNFFGQPRPTRHENDELSP